jgi:hypothetical protein
VDLSAFDGQERDEQARRLAREELEQRFDLSRGPLLRIKLLYLEHQEYVLLLTMHHIVSDGWSMGILIRELSELYKAYDRGEQSQLAELAIQYTDFSQWQREWLTGETLRRQTDFWKNSLDGVTALELPTDYPRGGRLISPSSGSDRRVEEIEPAAGRDNLHELYDGVSSIAGKVRGPG